MPTVAITGTVIKQLVPHRVKSLFVIFDNRALRLSALSIRVPGCQKLRLNLVWHTHAATVAVKGLIITQYISNFTSTIILSISRAPSSKK